MSGEELSPYSALTSFSGADMLVVLNGRAIGEVEEVDYKESFIVQQDKDGNFLPQVMGKIKTIMFLNKKPLSGLIKGVDDELAILFANEAGSQARIIFADFRFTNRTSKLSIDNMVLHEFFHFAASEVRTDMEKWEYKDGEYISKVTET